MPKPSAIELESLIKADPAYREVIMKLRRAVVRALVFPLMFLLLAIGALVLLASTTNFTF